MIRVSVADKMDMYEFLLKDILTQWHSGSPSQCFFETRPHRWQVRIIIQCWHSIAANPINLLLRFLLPLGMKSHSHEEVLRGAADGDNTNHGLETQHASRQEFIFRSLLQSRIASPDKLAKVPTRPRITGQRALEEPLLSYMQIVQPPCMLLFYSCLLIVSPWIVSNEVADVPQRNCRVDKGSRDGHLVERDEGLIAVMLPLCRVTPSKSAHDTTGKLANVGMIFLRVNYQRHEESLDLSLNVAVKVLLRSCSHGCVHPLSLKLP